MQTEAEIIKEMIEQEREEEGPFRRELAGKILLELLKKAPANYNRNNLILEAVTMTDILLNRLKIHS